MTTTVTRRDLFKFGGLAALGVAGASTLAGCGQPKTVAEAAAEKGLADTGAATGPAFLAPQEPITDFAETHEYDVVVVGAGESGLSAVHTALEAGARVACVQNINAAQTTGNMAASIDLTQTDEAAVQACVSFINWKSDYRSNRDLVNIWAHNSQEALAWWAEEAAKGGVESKPHDAVLSYNGYDIHLHANTYFHVEGNHNAAATVIAENLAAAGAEFFYNMPCKQLPPTSPARSRAPSARTPTGRTTCSRRPRASFWPAATTPPTRRCSTTTRRTPRASRCSPTSATARAWWPA